MGITKTGWLKINIFIGIETYKNSKQIQNKDIISCLKSFLLEKICIVSNLLSDDIKILSKLDHMVECIFDSLNPGIIIASYIVMRISRKSREKYHLILNPDVYFEQEVLEELFYLYRK